MQRELVLNQLDLVEVDGVSGVEMPYPSNALLLSHSLELKRTPAGQRVHDGTVWIHYQRALKHEHVLVATSTLEDSKVEDDHS